MNVRLYCDDRVIAIFGNVLKDASKYEIGSTLKLLAFPLAVLVLSASVAGCSEVDQRTGSSTASGKLISGSSRTPPLNYLNDGDHDQVGDSDTDNSLDNDNDAATDYKKSEASLYHDRDDEFIVNFGQAANAADRHSIVVAVRRYDKTAALGEGAKACAELFPRVSASIAEDYGRAPGPPALRGATCAVVMSKLFKLHRPQLIAANATLKLTEVRVQGERAYALLGSGLSPATYILMYKEGDGWRIGSLLSSVLP